MDTLQKKVAQLELQNDELSEYIKVLKDDIASLKESKKILKKYLKENKDLFKGFIRQGLKIKDGSEFYGWHYVVFPLTGIPRSLDIVDVKSMIQDILQVELADTKFKDYSIESIDYSERGSRWHVQVGKAIPLQVE
jgi:hypothetical protein